jgi:plastocyanin domain-containing protein
MRISKRLITVVIMLVISVVGIALFGNQDQKQPEVAGVDSTAPKIYVKAGYNPREVTLPANTDSVINFVTDNTYDCSASLLIPKLQIERFLPPTGTTSVAIPPQSAGTEIIAGCSMGMYSFKIKFI